MKPRINKIKKSGISHQMFKCLDPDQTGSVDSDQDLGIRIRKSEPSGQNGALKKGKKIKKFQV
jgi:hypothetical protein